MTFFRTFRALVDEIQRLSAHLRALRETYSEAAPSLDRLEALELSRAQFEADMEGLLQRAEGKLKAASNSEARERTMRKSYEADADPFPEDSEEIERRVQDFDAESVDAEEVQPMHLGLEKNSKAHALRAKWS